MKKRMWVAALIVFAFTFNPSRAPSADSVPKTLEEMKEEVKLAPFRGLKGVNVLVEIVSDDARRMGVTEENLQTTAELCLRKANIPVLPMVPKQIEDSPPPSLYVHVELYISDDKRIAYFSINVDLREGVMLERDPKTFVTATTWTTGVIGIAKPTDGKRVKDNLVEHVEKFCNLYLAAGGKKTPTPTQP